MLPRITHPVPLPHIALHRHTTLQVAQQLRDAGGPWVPQVVVCSNSLRTRQTLDVMQRVLPELADADAHFLGSLYTTAALDGQTRGHLSDTLAAVAAPAHACCLCIGHNRGWEEAASSFAVGGSGTGLSAPGLGLPVVLARLGCLPASQPTLSASELILRWVVRLLLPLPACRESLCVWATRTLRCSSAPPGGRRAGQRR